MKRLCAGCGAPGCGCTPDAIKAQLEKDRAEVSDRAAEVTRRSLDAAGELLELRAAVGGLALILAAQALRDRLDADAWEAWEAANDEASRKVAEGFERARLRDAEANGSQPHRIPP